MAKENIENAVPTAPVAAPTAVAATNGSSLMTANINLSGNQGLKVLAFTAGIGIFGYVAVKVTNKLTRTREKKLEITDK